MSVVDKFKSMDYGPAPEDPTEVLVWLDGHKRRFGHFIGGTWQQPSEGKYFETSDPSTTERLAEVAQGSAADIDNAVKAARKALPDWQKLSPPFAREISLRNCQAGAKAFAKAGCARDFG